MREITTQTHHSKRSELISYEMHPHLHLSSIHSSTLQMSYLPHYYHHSHRIIMFILRSTSNSNKRINKTYGCPRSLCTVWEILYARNVGMWPQHF